MGQTKTVLGLTVIYKDGHVRDFTSLAKQAAPCPEGLAMESEDGTFWIIPLGAMLCYRHTQEEADNE